MVRNIHRAETVLNAVEVMADQRVVDVTEARNKKGSRVVTITKRSWDDIQSTRSASTFIKKLCVSRDVFELESDDQNKRRREES